MGELEPPGGFVDERSGTPAIRGRPSSRTAFVDGFARGRGGVPVTVASHEAFRSRFGGVSAASEAGYGIRAFFANGGEEAVVLRVGSGRPAAADLIGALPALDGFDLLCLPAAAALSEADAGAVYAAALERCEGARALLLIDLPRSLGRPGAVAAWLDGPPSLRHPSAVAYAPLLRVRAPRQPGGERMIGASGAVAGVFARIAAARGVWHAPAGVEAVLRGTLGPAEHLSDARIEALVEVGVNPLRSVDAGTVIWGARTLAGSVAPGPEWRYVNVRRLALFLERTIGEGTRWAVFERNGEPLWSTLRRAVGDFLAGLWRSGALVGTTPAAAFFVRCDATTMTQDDLLAGRCIVEVGFAPLRPAEFVVIRIGLWTADRCAG